MNNRLISVQLESILIGLSENGISHLSDIESDLLQTTLLLDEAIAKLVASFMAINGAINVHQEMMSALLSEHAIEKESASGLMAISDELGRHINDAVTGLQFEDMTRQLIERVMRRVTGLRGILASLGSSSVGIGKNLDQKELHALLRSLNKQIELQNNELNEMLWKKVYQKHMDSGDVELFG